MPVPQRLTALTFGARNVPALRAFYEAIGWRVNDGSDDMFMSFTMGSLRLALYPIEPLHAEAAPGEPVIASGSWNGVTLTLNVATRDEVAVTIAAAVAAGATVVGTPVEREWGGYTGYFADPEGHRWEVAWAPFFTNVEWRPPADP